MNHGKRQRCSLYFSLCEKLKNQATSKVTSAHWRASIKWYIKPPGMLSWWHLSKQKFIDRLSTNGVIRNHPQTQKSTDVKKTRDNKRPPSDRKLHQEPTHLWVYPKLFVVSSGLIKRAAIGEPRYPREKSWGSLDEIRPGPWGFENMKGWKMKD